MTQLLVVAGCSFFLKRGSAMKLIGLLLLTTAASLAISPGEYSISELTVRNIPATKPNGSAWDAMNSPADLYVVFYLRNFGNDYHQMTWGTKQNCGTSATWSSDCVLFLSQDLTDGDQSYLKFVIMDEDPDADDLVDIGMISFRALSLGSNQLTSERGSQVSFVLERCQYDVGDYDYIDTIRPEVVETIGEASRCRYLRDSDLEGLSYREIKLVRNYSYACYDRPFGVRWIREYFLDNMVGYRGNGPEDPNLNAIERENISFIQEYEHENNIPVMNN